MISLYTTNNSERWQYRQPIILLSIFFDITYCDLLIKNRVKSNKNQNIGIQYSCIIAFFKSQVLIPNSIKRVFIV